MSFASSNRVALRQIPEVNFGVTPTSPVFTPIRFTGESLNYNLSNIVSEEIRDDRQVTDLIQVQSDASGDINIEFSGGGFDESIAGVMASAWSIGLNFTATDVSAVAATKTYQSVTGAFAGLAIGQVVRITGFTNPINNGFKRVTGRTATSITVAENVIDASAGPSVTISGSMIRNGTQLKSYTIQKVFSDLTTPLYHNYVGARYNTMSMNVQTGQIVTGAFGIMALGSNQLTNQIAGATVAAAPTGDVLNAVGNVVGITLDGVPSTAYFNTLSLQLNNNLRAQDAVGSLPHIGIALGRLDVTGTLNLYLEDASMYDKYLNAQAFSLSFNLLDSAGNHPMTVTLPRIKFETGQTNAGGRDQDVMLNANFRAIFDPVTSCTIQIDKFY